jgi:phosphoserine phosphatase RsbX
MNRRLVADDLPLVQYGVACVPARGEIESGDLHLLARTRRGLLSAVVDGLGHGAAAASTARVAIETLAAHPDEGVIPLIWRCHERLKGTRGAVISLVSFDGLEDTITWVGVGNIEGVLLNGNAEGPGPPSILLRPGVVGYRLPPLQAVVQPVVPGDLLILFTDGIRDDFPRHFAVDTPPSQIAEYIASGFRRGSDDALVFVARYRGVKES